MVMVGTFPLVPAGPFQITRHRVVHKCGAFSLRRIGSATHYVTATSVSLALVPSRSRARREAFP